MVYPLDLFRCCGQGPMLNVLGIFRGPVVRIQVDQKTLDFPRQAHAHSLSSRDLELGLSRIGPASEEIAASMWAVGRQL